MYVRICGHRGNCTGTPVASFDTDTNLWTASCAVCRTSYKPSDSRVGALLNWDGQIKEPEPAVPATTKRKRA